MINKVWIVVVNYNGWDDTRACLASLAKLTVPASVVLVDNASREDRLDEMQAAFPGIETVRNPINGGWAGGNNTGIRHALERGAEQIILLNNDTTVSPHLVEALLAAATAYPDYGILGPVIYRMDDPGTVMTDGTVFNRRGHNGFFERKAVPLDEATTPAVVEVDIVNGCCMMIAAKVVERIGTIDERFFLIHEETDFCLRAVRAGFRCGVLGAGLVWHKGSVTFKSTGQRLQRYYDARNLLLLLVKHAGGRPEWRRLPASLLTWAKYVYYRYDVERENGCTEAADAVVTGVADALSCRYRAERAGARWTKPILRLIFGGWWRLRHVTPRQPAT